MAAVLHRVSTTHFKRTHPNRHNGVPMPISMQLTYLRRTAEGPALITVQDIKLGARTSTIHITLSQEDPPKLPSLSSPASPTASTQSARLVGYITISDPVAEVGVSGKTGWKLSPPAPPGHPATGSWALTPTLFPKFRHAANRVEIYKPATSQKKKGILDVWTRIRPIIGDQDDDKPKWTDEGVAFLVDMYPMPVDGAVSSSDLQSPPGGAFWFPTVTLNIDFKKQLPAGGVEWLYSRVQTKAVRNGRLDIGITIMDEDGEVVALGNQVALVLDASRNTSGRQSSSTKSDAEKAKM
jgi:acyl-CoA thioesterase FadM